MRVALYARVSMALKQDPEMQFVDLRRWAELNRHEVMGEFLDEISSRDLRPQKEMVVALLRRGEIQGVAFWALDRWGRSMGELVLDLEEFCERGWLMFSFKESLDLSSAAGRAFAHILSAFANFERDRIQERTRSGVARAKAIGKIRGRHPQDCGCGHYGHHGLVKPIREGQVIVAWAYPDLQVVMVGDRHKPLPQKVERFRVPRAA